MKLQQAGSKYEGQTNEQGQHNGKGLCRYVDGSVYDGEWKDGKRHGQGQYTFANGVLYRGGWESDQMHGQGILYLTDGEQIQTSWIYNLRHGEGFIIDKAGVKHQVQYYRDLQIRQSEQNPDCFDKTPLNLFLDSVILLFFGLIFYTGDWRYGIGSLIFYIIMLAECGCSKTSDFVKNVEPYSRTGQIID